MNSAVKTKAQHTPGPWEVGPRDRGNGEIRIAQGGYAVAIATNRATDAERLDVPRQRANAHLIAAAPDMYEALKGLIALAESGESVEEPLELIAAGREAIAKAEGRQ